MGEEAGREGVDEYGEFVAGPVEGGKGCAGEDAGAAGHDSAV